MKLRTWATTVREYQRIELERLIKLLLTQVKKMYAILIIVAVKRTLLIRFFFYKMEYE